MSPVRTLALVAALALLPLRARAQDPETPPGPELPQLHLLCWDNYFAATTLSDFETEFKCKVRLTTYGSNEEMQKRLDSGLVGFDLIFPSDYMIRKLVRENQVERLDQKKLPNLKNIAPRFRGLSFDPRNLYSVPYMWGTTGLGLNRIKVSGKVDTWTVLFDEKYKGKILMLDDPRECLGIALKYLGKSVNSRNKADLEAAKALLMKQKPLVVGYKSEEYWKALVDGSAWICLGYNGDILTARKEHSEIFYAVPEEGTILWCDNLCIVSGSDHIDLAHQFINYILRPEVASKITNEIFFASANGEAEKLVRKDVLLDRSIFPIQKILEKSEFLEEVGSSAATYEQIWAEIKGEGGK